MNTRVDPNLMHQMKEFGASDWNACFHCGNCTATCPLSETETLFPRKDIRNLQLGLKQSISKSVDPWLCYYCGDCSTSCPRNANPGELMMSLRRYLTSVYDWTGISKLFYTKHWVELFAIGLIALIVVLLFTLFNPNGIVHELNAQGGVRINEMFPVHWVHIGDLVMAIGVALFLLINISRMWYLSVYKDKSVSFSMRAYIIGLKDLFIHFSSQKKFNKCDDKRYWGAHWLLMTGYTLMFAMIVFFLGWFQTEEIVKWYHPQRLLGYYATFGLFVGMIYFIIGRIKKNRETFKYSHFSDWIFLILLFSTTLSGILLHFFRIAGLPTATYIMYVIHLAVLIPMIIVEVPFSKWSHLAYRPFAIYFSNIKKASRERVKVDTELALINKSVEYGR